MNEQPYPIVAAVDIGTNSVLLLVATRRNGGWVALTQECIISRLGRGVDKTKALSQAGVDATLAALRAHKRSLRRFDVTSLRAVGTSALRDADNAHGFLDAAKAILGVPVEVIGGQREAELVVGGVRSSLKLPPKTLVFDVGGGSTEFIGVSEGGAVEMLVSLDMGSVRLTERMVRDDPPSDDTLNQIRAEIQRHLRTLPQDASEGPCQLVGVAGTVTTLVTSSRAIEPYDAEQVDGSVLTLPEIESEISRYASTPLAERQQIRGLEPKRADVIIAGSLIVAECARHMGVKSLRVSDRGVRWGLAGEMWAAEVPATKMPARP